MTLWTDRADLAHASLTYYFGASEPQYLDNWYPSGPETNSIFNYWWLAHVMDARLDAFERTGEQRWLDETIAVRDNLVARNGGSLFNDYFDDMLWFGLALERLARLGVGSGAGVGVGGPSPDGGANDAASVGTARFAGYLDEARQIWDHCLEYGWNDTCGPSLAWRKPQLYYKNTPANGPFVILGARLFRATGEDRFLRYAKASFAWIESTMRGEDGFIEDGVNREQDGRVDTQWRFTYNQGLYVGACVALHEAGGVDGVDLLDRATQTAVTATRELTVDGVFADEGPDGDEGLFKGIYYRYAGLLHALRPVAEFSDFLRSSADALWANGMRDDFLLPANDWRVPFSKPIPYSTMLSAIMATEARAAVEG